MDCEMLGIWGIVATVAVGVLSYVMGRRSQKTENEKLRADMSEELRNINRGIEALKPAEDSRDDYKKLIQTVHNAQGKIEARSSVKGTATVIKSGEKR